MSSGVWCGGGLGKQRTAQPRGDGENSIFFEIVLLRRSVWQWWRFGVKEAEVRREELFSEGWVSFFVLFGVCLERGFKCELSVLSSFCSGDQAVRWWRFDVMKEAELLSKGFAFLCFLFCLR
nr:hypothetical protein CFP56_50751 [Quercus suber]